MLLVYSTDVILNILMSYLRLNSQCHNSFRDTSQNLHRMLHSLHWQFTVSHREQWQLSVSQNDLWERWDVVSCHEYAAVVYGIKLFHVHAAAAGNHNHQKL